MTGRKDNFILLEIKNENEGKFRTFKFISAKSHVLHFISYLKHFTLWFTNNFPDVYVLWQKVIGLAISSIFCFIPGFGYKLTLDSFSL